MQDDKIKKSPEELDRMIATLAAYGIMARLMLSHSAGQSDVVGRIKRLVDMHGDPRTRSLAEPGGTLDMKTVDELLDRIQTAWSSPHAASSERFTQLSCNPVVAAMSSIILFIVASLFLFAWCVIAAWLPVWAICAVCGAPVRLVYVAVPAALLFLMSAPHVKLSYRTEAKKRSMRHLPHRP